LALACTYDTPATAQAGKVTFRPAWKLLGCAEPPCTLVFGSLIANQVARPLSTLEGADESTMQRRIYQPSAGELATKRG